MKKKVKYLILTALLIFSLGFFNNVKAETVENAPVIVLKKAKIDVRQWQVKTETQILTELGVSAKTVDDIAIPLSQIKIMNFDTLDFTVFKENTISIRAYDLDKNTSSAVSAVVNVTYYPMIKGPGVVYRSENSILTVGEVLKTYTCLDPGNAKLDIKIIDDNYTGNANNPGEKTLVLKAEYDDSNTDTENLIAKKTVKIITVKDLIDVVVYEVKANSYKITVSDYMLLKKKDFVNLLQKIDVVPTTTNTYVSVLSDNYTEYYNVENSGGYDYKIEIENTAGYHEEFEFNVVVTSSDAEIIKQPKLNFFQKLWNGIVNIFKSIWNFIVRIFSGCNMSFLKF